MSQAICKHHRLFPCLNCHEEQELAEMRTELATLREQLACAVGALRSLVGFEPFNSVEPYRASETLAKIRGGGG